MIGSELRFRRGVVVLVVWVAALAAAPVAGAVPKGDVMVSVSGGKVQEWTPAGSGATLVKTLDTTTGSVTTGSGFDSNGNFYVTDFSLGAVSEFDPGGALIGNFGSGYTGSPESLVFSQAGNMFVGQVNTSSDVLEFAPAGGAPVATFSPAVEARGTDWIDLAADQCTLHYTSEGKAVKTFNVCTNTQGPDFASGLPGSNAFAHRILPGGGELVADSNQVVRLDASGSVVQSYTFPGEGTLFALNLDPNGTSFWTADIGTGDVIKASIATGAVESQFNTGTGSNTVFGLSVAGEITAATDPPITATGAAALTATEGKPLTATVATFTDPETAAPPSEYSASINWGDGTTSPGTITGSNGSFTVNGTHTYGAAPGSRTITVAITDVDNTPNAATASTPANVSPPKTGKPTVLRGPPVKTTTSRATLGGSVNPDGLQTTYHFEYGLDGRYRLKRTPGIVYDQRTPDQGLAASSPATVVTASATRLVPNALYHSRLVAVNAAGTTFGPDQTFRTKRDRKSPPKPVLGKSFDGAVVSGLVLIKPPRHASARAHGGRAVRVTLLPKSHGFFPLTEPLSLPAGTQIDARRGSLRIVTAAAQRRKTQSGVFGLGLFSIRQDSRGATKALTTLAVLEGAYAGAPSYSACRSHAKAAQAGIARLSARVLQTLKSRVRGRFRTRGRYSASTVRGTGWVMSDRCNGTLTVVRRGTVEVTDFVRHVTVVVHAGHRYFAAATKRKHK